MNNLRWLANNGPRSGSEQHSVSGEVIDQGTSVKKARKVVR